MSRMGKSIKLESIGVPAGVEGEENGSDRVMGTGFPLRAKKCFEQREAVQQWKYTKCHCIAHLKWCILLWYMNLTSTF